MVAPQMYALAARVPKNGKGPRSRVAGLSGRSCFVQGAYEPQLANLITAVTSQTVSCTHALLSDGCFHMAPR